GTPAVLVPVIVLDLAGMSVAACAVVLVIVATCMPSSFCENLGCACLRPQMLMFVSVSVMVVVVMIMIMDVLGGNFRSARLDEQCYCSDPGQDQQGGAAEEHRQV